MPVIHGQTWGKFILWLPEKWGESVWAVSVEGQKGPDCFAIEKDILALNWLL